MVQFSPAVSQFQSNMARAGERGRLSISLFTQPQGLTPWGSHTGRYRLPHSMAASGPQLAGGSFVIFSGPAQAGSLLPLCIGYEQVTNPPRFQGRRGGGARCHPLAGVLRFQGLRTCGMGKVSWPFWENNTRHPPLSCCPLQEGLGAAEAVRAMRPPEPRLGHRGGAWLWDCGERWTGAKRWPWEGHGEVGFCLFHPPQSCWTTEALAWQVAGTFLTPEQQSSSRCQVPTCANLGSPTSSPPQKKGSSQKILLVNRWIEGDLKLRSNSESAAPQLRCSRTESSFLPR